MVLACPLGLNHNIPFLAEHVRGDLYLLTAAGHSAGSGVPKMSLPDPHHPLLFVLFLVLLFAGLCRDQRCLTGSSVIEMLTLSSALGPSLSFRFHLKETANSFSPSSKSFFFWSKQNGQGLTTLTGKTFFQISHLTVLCVSVEPFPFCCHSRPLSEVLCRTRPRLWLYLQPWESPRCRQALVVPTAPGAGRLWHAVPSHPHCYFFVLWSSTASRCSWTLQWDSPPACSLPCSSLFLCSHFICFSVSGSNFSSL